MTTSWARLKIKGLPWMAWAKFPGKDIEETELLAMKMIADLKGWWNIYANYQVSDTVPMEE